MRRAASLHNESYLEQVLAEVAKAELKVGVPKGDPNKMRAKGRAYNKARRDKAKLQKKRGKKGWSW